MEWGDGQVPYDSETIYHHASPRRRRLFHVACCKRIWPLLTDPRSRAAVEVAELYAEGLTDDAELDASANAAEAVLVELGLRAEPQWHGNWTAEVSAAIAACEVAARDNEVADWVYYECDRRAAEAERKLNPSREGLGWEMLWQDIFGELYLEAKLWPCWLSENGGAVPILAETIYNNRQFELMPVLADALEEAGCTEAAVLEHCRDSGPHVLGCWVLDLLLGKE